MSKHYPVEQRERAVKMVLDHLGEYRSVYAASQAIGPKVGVGPETFIGTETGTVTDVFVPAMMHPGAVHDDWTWMRTLARVNPGVALEPLRATRE